MLFVRSLITLGAAVALAACNVTADDRWTRLRDALARTPADARALALAAAIERAPDRGPIALGTNEADALAALGALDRARALAGVDAWVGGQLDLGDRPSTRACSMLLGDDGSLGSIDAWLATCPTPPATPPERVTVAGLPALAAWSPSEGRVYLHPLFAVGASAASLIASGTDCPAELDDFCQRCPTGAEAGCDPLFGPGTQPVACAVLDAIPEGRPRYCAWRGAASEPWVRLLFLQASDGPCWDASVTVRDVESLALAIPSASGDCATRLVTGLRAAAEDLELALSAPTTPGPEGYQAWPLRRCADWIENVQCAACSPDPEAQCVGFFASSSAAGDCFDLRRAESQGGGFAAMCAWEYNLAFIQRECVNLYGPCYDGRFYAKDARSYENLVAAFPGFFDPDRRDRCIDQWQACHDANPFHDLDITKAIPTPSVAPTAMTMEEDKCPL